MYGSDPIALRKMLADGGQRSLNEEMRAIVERMTAGTWKQDKAKLQKLVANI